MQFFSSIKTHPSFFTKPKNYSAETNQLSTIINPQGEEE